MVVVVTRSNTLGEVVLKGFRVSCYSYWSVTASSGLGRVVRCALIGMVNEAHSFEDALGFSYTQEHCYSWVGG
jgi:hypothetical protein